MNDRLNISHLETAYNKLPVNIKTTLAISEGEVEVSGWKQFKSRYIGRPLAYDNTDEGREAADSRFTEIVFDNMLLIEQIRLAKQYIFSLGNLDNWKLVTLTLGTGSSKNQNISFNASTGKDLGADKVDTKNRTGISDSNSFGYSEPGSLKLLEPVTSIVTSGTTQVEDQNYYPLNALNQADTATVGNRQSDTKNMGASLNDGVNIYENASKVESSNTSEDLRNYLTLRIPELRNEFWSKFDVLFLWMI